jgi:hypothetical protein
MAAEEPKERGQAKVAILVALIGAAATILAALITLIPSLRTATGQERPPDDKPEEKPPFKATMDDCVGKWRWQTKGRAINFDLDVAGSFTAEDFPNQRVPHQGLGLFRDGKGHWSVKDGRLTITMTHVWVGAVWVAEEVTWIDAKKVTAVSRNEVTLEGDEPLRRR